jgi:hypothetical protein
MVESRVHQGSYVCKIAVRGRGLISPKSPRSGPRRPGSGFDLVFGALADATRRDIVLRALDGDEGVAELAGHYPMSFAAVQKHVAVLERAGLVGKHRVGRRKVVRTELEGLRIAQRLLDRYEVIWRGRIAVMTTILEETKETHE